MSNSDEFMRAISANPEDDRLRLIYADWLEDRGDPRGELLRLLHTLTQSIRVRGRPTLEDRLRALLKSGVQPVGPFWTNSLGMKFAWIPAGVFVMGSPVEEEHRASDETHHKVTLTRGFYLAIHPVTQEIWRAVVGNHPNFRRGDDLPVELATWNDSQEFLQRLSEREDREYRLPTEAEWEYACRAGTTTPFHFGKKWSDEDANCNNKLGRTSSVGSYPPNAFGLYDMHGNVSEWCSDWYGDYPNAAATDPLGFNDGEDRRVKRGGCYRFGPDGCRAACRSRSEPDWGSGFRVAFHLD